MKLSAVVLAYITTVEQEKLTRECVGSLEDADELIIVDNGSTLNTAWLEEWGNVVRLERNVSYPTGINVGIKQATGSHIAFVSNDTRVTSGDLTSMIDDGLVFPKVTWGVKGYSHPFYHGGFYVFPNESWTLHDTRFEFYFSDIDLFLRARSLGKVFRQEPSVEIFHHLWKTIGLNPKKEEVYRRDAGTFIQKLLS